MIYYPELDQEPERRLFNSSHVINSKYSVFWRESDDKAAREALAKLGVRVDTGKKNSVDSRYHKVGEWSEASKAGENGYSVIVTFRIAQTLIDQDLTAHKMLLD